VKDSSTTRDNCLKPNILYCGNADGLSTGFRVIAGGTFWYAIARFSFALLVFYKFCRNATSNNSCVLQLAAKFQLWRIDRDHSKHGGRGTQSSERVSLQLADGLVGSRASCENRRVQRRARHRRRHCCIENDRFHLSTVVLFCRTLLVIYCLCDGSAVFAV
jgi:hypothetical protein